MTNNKTTERADLAQALISLDKKRTRIHLRQCPELDLIDEQESQIIEMIIGNKQ